MPVCTSSPCHSPSHNLNLRTGGEEQRGEMELCCLHTFCMQSNADRMCLSRCWQFYATAAVSHNSWDSAPPLPKSTQEEVLKESLVTFSWISGEADTRNITCWPLLFFSPSLPLGSFHSEASSADSGSRSFYPIFPVSWSQSSSHIYWMLIIC